MSDRPANDARRLARSSAWMALGTIASRLTGFVRALLLAWTIGTALDADLFDAANTIPNTAYILVAGGIFNVVLVPQLVRAMQRDEDGGEAYAQRVVSLGLMVLAVATVLLTLLVPWILRLVFDSALFLPENTVQRESAELLMYLCMPQVFFYGAFVLVGQVLNSRERFGPMMWAPVVNNLVACAVIGVYLVAFGTATGAGARDGYSTNEALLLGLGSTFGIVVQSLLLVPFLRQVGFTFRLRTDLRGVGMGHTLKLGAWTLGFIVANQIAYIVVVKLATGGTLAGAASGQDSAGGSTVYALGFLVSQVPHGVVTVSLATAVMPTLSRLAHAGDFGRFRLELGRTVRLVLSLVAPLAVAVACLGQTAAAAISFGALADNHVAVGLAVSAFSLAMVAFCLHFLMLRGFYAREDTRTPFFLQVVVASVNIALAIVLTRGADPTHVAAMLALAYGLAYLVGSVLSITVLSRHVGTVVDHESRVFALRLLVSCGAAAAVMIGALLALDAAGLDLDRPGPAVIGLVVAGVPGALAYLVVARLVGMDQLRYLVSSLRNR